MPQTTLGNRILAFDISTPLGTAIATPQSTLCDLAECTIDRLEILIPSGHLGFTGIALEYGGQRLIPAFQNSAWIIGDNNLLTYVMDFDVGQPVTIKTYNTGSFVHHHYLRFHVSDIVLPSINRASRLLPL